MMNKKEMKIGSRKCFAYEEAGAKAVLIQAVDDNDLESLDIEIEEISRRANGKAFRLYAFKIEDWNQELSPWEAPPVFGNEAFGTGAADTLSFVTGELLPLIQREGAQPVIIGGYSLAGLFALWAGCQTNAFEGIAAASPSVWFPGWSHYISENKVKSRYVYLSLGDKEEKARNPVLAKVGENIRMQEELLRRDSEVKQVILEMNEGNHFRDVAKRTAKGFSWVLERVK